MRLNSRENLELHHAGIKNRRSSDGIAQRTLALRAGRENSAENTDQNATHAWLRHEGLSTYQSNLIQSTVQIGLTKPESA